MFDSAVTRARMFTSGGKTAVLCCGLAAVALVTAGIAQPAAALVINPVFDSPITPLANASTIQAAFNTVAQKFASQFTNGAQINIKVSWGSVGGQILSSNAVGQAPRRFTGILPMTG